MGGKQFGKYHKVVRVVVEVVAKVVVLALRHSENRSRVISGVKSSTESESFPFSTDSFMNNSVHLNVLI